MMVSIERKGLNVIVRSFKSVKVKEKKKLQWSSKILSTGLFEHVTGKHKEKLVPRG